jgi:hypothetical protein
VIWWEKGFYPQEDSAVREIIAAFEQGSSKQVDVTFYEESERWLTTMWGPRDGDRTCSDACS